MFTKRIIPCLDVHAGRVVKGVNFVNLSCKYLIYKYFVLTPLTVNLSAVLFFENSMDYFELKVVSFC